MGTLTIVDDCLTPDRYIYLTYSGPDPWGVVKKITDSIRGFFHVSASGYNQVRLNWDDTSDPITFYAKWWVRRKMSRQTIILIDLWVQGSKSKVDNTGQFTLRINANVLTTVSGPGFLLNPFWLVYSYLFYNRIRRRFLYTCKSLVLNFRNEIKEHYNMGITTVPQAHTVFGSW